MTDKNLKEERRHGAVSCYCIRPPYAASLEQLECHWHDEMELFRVEQGAAQVQCGSTCFEVKAGDLVFFNSGELHAAQSLTDAALGYDAVVFSPELLCGDRNDLIRVKYVSPVMEGRLVPRRVIRGQDGREQEMLREFDEAVALLTGRPETYELRVQARLLDIFAGLAESGLQASVRREKEPSQGIKAAIEYIRGNYRQPIALEKLAAISHLSAGHFCRLFKKYTFKTPVQYVNSLRLAAAADLLAKSDRKELDIVFDVGFNSLSYFIGVFKQNYGCTPAEFRRKNRMD